MPPVLGRRVSLGFGVAAIAAVVVGAGVPQARAAPGPEELTLRLSDLAPGYLIGDDSGCGLGLAGDGAPRSLITLARRYRPRGCVIQFERLWVPTGEVPGPPLVESTALHFGRETGATAGFARASALVAHLAGVRRESLERLPVATAIGDSLAAFRTNDALVAGRARRPGALVLWRTGRVLSLVFAAGQTGSVGEQAALRLAEIQQARIAAPTPLSPGENDDRVLPLDNPRLGIDVYWLGPRLRPPGRLPTLVLANSFGPLGPGASPGWRAEIDYTTPGRGEGVKLGLWKPAAFGRYTRTRLGRLVRTQRCARVTRLGLPSGRAVIYGGYSTPPKRCAQRRPDLYLAHVFLRGVVVSVNAPLCFLCVQAGTARRDSYDSLSGMRAVVERLRPRTPDTGQ